jgi:hypothetical protein
VIQDPAAVANPEERGTTQIDEQFLGLGDVGGHIVEQRLCRASRPILVRSFDTDELRWPGLAGWSASASGSEEVPTERAAFGSIRRDFPDPVDAPPRRSARLSE